MGKGGKGKGAGQWVFVPQGGFFGGGKGHKGKGRMSMVRRMAKTNPERCVWIGGLAEKDTDKDFNKKLQAWIGKSCEGCKFMDIGPRGRGGAIFGTEEEASTAIAVLNGQKFAGKVLEFDVYVKGWNNDEE